MTVDMINQPHLHRHLPPPPPPHPHPQLHHQLLLYRSVCYQLYHLNLIYL